MPTQTPKSHYNLEAWAAETDLGRRLFNHNYRMTGTEMRGWELIKTTSLEHEPGLVEFIYIWERKGSDGKQQIRFGVVETNDWRLAQAQLQAALIHSMRSAIPRTEGKLAAIGDVSYFGQSDDTHVVATLFFSRGNLAVYAASVGEEAVDVARLARRLDRDVSEPPKKGDIEALHVEDRSRKPLELKRKGRVTLVERLPERGTREGWLKVIVPDGEIAREGNELVYLAPKAGSKRVREFVVPLG